MTLGELIDSVVRKSPHTNTLQKLALKVDISYSYLCRIVKGTHSPSGEVLEKILDALEVNVSTRHKAWVLLAARQLDDVVRAHVRLSPSPSEFIESAAWIAMEVATENFPTITAEKRKKILNDVKERLCQMTASGSTR